MLYVSLVSVGLWWGGGVREKDESGREWHEASREFDYKIRRISC